METDNPMGGGVVKRWWVSDLPEDVRVAIMLAEQQGAEDLPACRQAGKPSYRQAGKPAPQVMAPHIIDNKDGSSNALVETGSGAKSLTHQVNNSEGLSPDQKKEALFKADLVKFYLQRVKKAGHGGKKQAREQFQEAYNAGAAYPEIFKVVGRTDWKTIERWKILLRRSKDPFILADQRGEARRGQGLISQSQAQVIIPLICNPHKLSTSTVIRRAKAIMAERQIDNGFSEDTYRRFINQWKAVNFDHVTFWHEGEHGMDEEVSPYLRRDWRKLEVGDVLVADGHVLNGEAINPETGKPKRMASIWWYDMRSNYPVGWEIMPTENTQAIASALRRAILRLGKLPKVLYLDNGKAFRARFFEGCQDFRQAGLTGLFERLGCRCVHAWPHHAQSKPIERFFGTFAELEQLSPSYTGTSIEHKPPRLRRGEHLHRRIHAKLTGGMVPTIEGWHRSIASWVDDYASRPQKSTHLKGMTPAQVFAQGRGPGVDPATLHDLMLHEKLTRINRNGVTLRIDGEPTDFHDRELYGRRHSVIVRFDPVGLALGDADSVLVYSPEGRDLICEARRMDKIHPMAEILGTEADVIKLKENIELKRSLKKETIGSAREFVETEVLPEVGRQAEWSMAKIQMTEDGGRRAEGGGRKADDGGRTPIDVSLTDEERDEVLRAVAERDLIEAEMKERYRKDADPVFLDQPDPDPRDRYAKDFWEEVEELAELDRYEKLLECEARKMLIPRKLVNFMRYFQETDKYLRLAEYFDKQRVFYAYLAMQAGGKEEEGE